jgi:hypothetical protein
MNPETSDHSPSPAKDRLLAGALFCAVLALFAVSYLRFFWGGQTFEFCSYAEIGSNILHGRGFATSSFVPSELAYLDAAGVPVAQTGPVLTRFPLFALWSAFWLALGGGRDFGMALGNGMAHALWVVVLFLAGRRIFGRRTAFIAAALWGLAPSMLAGFDLFGHPDVLFGALLAWLNLLIWRSPEPQRPLGGYVSLGLLAGACYLARHSFGIWLPFYVGLFWWRARPRLRPAAAFLGGFAALAVPWTLYYWSRTGRAFSPLFLWNLAEGTLVRGLPWMEYRTYAWPDFFHWEAAGQLCKKAVSLFNFQLGDLATFWTMPLAFPLAAAGLATAAGASAALGGWLILLLGWQMVVFSFLRTETLAWATGRYYLWLAPFVLFYAVDFLDRRRESRAWRWGALALAALLLQSWAFTYFAVPRSPDHPSGRPISEWPELAYLRERTEPTAWVATNIPSQVSWYAGRRAFNIPNHPAQLALMERLHPADYLLLGDYRIGEPFNFPEWVDVFQGRSGLPAQEAFAQMGFAVEQNFPGAVLLRKTRDAAARPTSAPAPRRPRAPDLAR